MFWWVGFRFARATPIRSAAPGRTIGIAPLGGPVFILAGLPNCGTGAAMVIVLPEFGPTTLRTSTSTIALCTILMIRGYGVGIAVATRRLTILPLFAIFGMPDLELVAMMVWFSLFFNLAVAEWIIRKSSLRFAKA